MTKMFRKWSNRLISGLEYFIGAYLVFNGLLTVFADPDDSVVGLMHILYGTHLGLIIAGLIIAASGLTLLVSKIKKLKKTHGRGLFYVYLCYLFATILNFIAYGGTASWVGNAIGILVVGALWLRWKFKTEYVNPRQFRNKTIDMRNDLPPRS